MKNDIVPLMMDIQANEHSFCVEGRIYKFTAWTVPVDMYQGQAGYWAKAEDVLKAAEKQ